MPPKLYHPWLAIVVFCAAVALVSFEASARDSSRCLTLSSYGEDRAGAEIINDCSECRKATIRRCDGTRLAIEVEGSAWAHVPGPFFDCTMQKTAESQCSEHQSERPSRKSRKRAVEAREDTARIAATTEKPAPKPSREHQAIPSGQATNDRCADRTNSTQAPSEAAGDKLAEVGPQENAPGAQTRIKAKTLTQMAAFPDLSEHDWRVLLSSESGQSLIAKSKALLNRKAVLQIVLGDLWFSSDAVAKQEEWIAAEREVQDINKKLYEFHKAAIAIIDRK
jgi:hypothetical protein